MPFKNRYRFEGTLKTLSPLHIGNGGMARREQLRDEAGPVDIAAAATDCRGKPYIPGSTLKGNLLAWLRRSGIDNQLVEPVFGTQDRGGKAEFHDSLLARHPAGPAGGIRWWSPERCACVDAHVAINAHTRTAEENKLYYVEYVPEDAVFEVVVTAQDLELEERSLLLYAFEGFSAEPDGIRLGSGTGDSWGKLEWKLTNVLLAEAGQVQEWLSSQPKMAGEVFRSLKAELGALSEQAQKAFARSAGSCRLTFHLKLDFEGPFLVNDPSQTAKGADKPDHAPLKNGRGKVLLPASSVRGALRGQARRIWRTIARRQPPGKRSQAFLEEAKDAGEHQKLKPFLRLFGAPGWRSPIEVSDFLPVDEGSEVKQDFVAIDRFTGGGEEGKKFDAISRHRPCFRGTVQADLEALARAGAGAWALAILLFTLRDLLEGDIRFGFGAGKGYGACRATLERSDCTDWSKAPHQFGPGLGRVIGAFPFSERTPEDVQKIVRDWIRDLEDQSREAA